jgi:protein-histidine pros-kinase
VYLLVGLVLFMFLAVNILLTTLVVRPVLHLAKIADQVSRGEDAPEFPAKSGDEVAALGLSFNRLRITVRRALQELESRPD